MIKLSTGKEVYANNDIIGIGPELDAIYEGYDGAIWTDDGRMTDHIHHLTRAERVEIADLMIKRWMEFRLIMVQKTGKYHD